jgi:hypothetical protein
MLSKNCRKLKGLIRMFEVKDETRMSITDKLLYNIWRELISLRKEIRNVEVKVEEPKPKKVYSCKYCGGTHDNPGQIATCKKKIEKG